jgi:dTDP-glucose 4,6-dehydratase
MVINALQNKPLPVYGDGKNIRDWLFVEDHCRTIDLVLKNGKVGETYCIGGGSERSNIDVVRQILAALHKSESLIQWVKDRPGHDRRYALDYSKAQRELGYSPMHSFEEYLVKTVQWYVHNETWWKRVLSQDYQLYYETQYKERLGQ